MQVARSLSLLFAAGALGGLVNSLVVWLCGESGVTHALGVAIAPELTPAFLYPRIVWGGLWGFAFAVPLGVRSSVRRGLLVSLAPAAYQLFVIFPRAGRGLLGLELGTLTPVLVLLFTAVWGVVTAWWLHGTSGHS
ncbi:MAG TPA: hypothetical protein VMS55_14005 [Myxococcota bacterium]|nr:hypothetical protein [Myxococcota bacterium]